MEHKCVVCHDNVATFRCVQCHKPVCDECAFKTENGAFCSRECAANYREFRRAEAKAPRARSGGLLKPLIGLIIIALIVLAIAYKMKPEWFSNVPFLSQPAEQAAN